jgi:hypothetical protein
VELFYRDYKVRLFLSWISPARSFGRREFLAMDLKQLFCFKNNKTCLSGNDGIRFFFLLRFLLSP